MKILPCFLASALAVLTTSAIASDELTEVKEYIPPQCYAEQVQEGIPATYSRGSIIDQPVLENRIDPDFPAEPTKSRKFFCAAFAYSVDEKGRAADIEMLYNSHPNVDGVDFAKQARKSLEKWRYQPGMIDKGPTEFLGYTAIFFKGYGPVEDEYAALRDSAAQTTVANDVSEDWQTYGRSVTQRELEQLELAAEQQVAPSAVEDQLPPEDEEPKVVYANHWTITEDGTVVTDNGVYEPDADEAEIYAAAIESSKPAEAVISDAKVENDVADAE